MSKGEENGAPQKKNRTNLLLAIVAVLALIGIAISVYTLFFNNAAPVTEDEEETVEIAGPYRQFGPLDFTVNLADSGQRNYLKVTVALAFEERGLAGELEERKAQVRDLIIDVLRSKAVADVNHSEGTNQLREELIVEINSIISAGEIREIYFTDFLVQ